jgi:hypothetical protein
MIAGIAREQAGSKRRRGGGWGDRVEVIGALVAFVALTVWFRWYGSSVAGGSDSYGYFSEALHLLHGQIYVPEHVFAPFGLPENSAMTYTLGWIPRGSAGLIPTYPFGYPLLLAAPLALGGLAAGFWVTPILAAGAVLLTYLAGRRALGRTGGALAALLVLALPNFLWSAAEPMSDAPATCFAALALVVLLWPDPAASAPSGRRHGVAPLPAGGTPGGARAQVGAAPGGRPGSAPGRRPDPTSVNQGPAVVEPGHLRSDALPVAGSRGGEDAGVGQARGPAPTAGRCFIFSSQPVGDDGGFSPLPSGEGGGEGQPGRSTDDIPSDTHLAPSPWLDLLLAFAEGFAIWIRPNLVLLVLPTVGWLLWRRDWWRLVRFGGALLPFVLVEAAVNRYLYGSPFASGYGALPLAPSLADAGQRAVRHLRRLQDQQVGLGLTLVALGVVAGALPRSRRLLLLAFGAVLLAFFAFYAIDDAWWYGRFLLPGLPAIALLEASGVVRWLAPGRALALRRGAVAFGAVAFTAGSLAYASGHGVFTLRNDDQRYQVAAQLVRQVVPEPALILTMQHSGSVRLYAGVPTARYDLGDPADVFTEMGEVARAGGPTYLVADDYEVTLLRYGKRSGLLLGAQTVAHQHNVTVDRLNAVLDPRTVEPDRPLQVTFGDPAQPRQIALLGADVRPAVVAPGAKVTVVLYWEAITVPSQSYAVFVHLNDAAGKTVAQSDSYPLDWQYPTDRWQPGYVVRDERQITLPSPLPAGPFQLQVGLYRRDTFQRLWPSGPSGRLPDNFVSLGPVR